jgi:serine/threonine-protein kinase RsbW
MSESVVHLAFPAKAEYLLLARLALSGVARGAPVDDELLADLKLAVTEACGNAVRHAYADDEGEVSVRYSVSGERLEMVVEDQGTGLEGTGLDGGGDTPHSRVPGGGMGMSIIRAIVDELDVEPGSDGRGTVVRMVKRLAPVSA